MDVPIHTLKRRMKENGLSIRDQFSKISDGDLDAVITATLKKFPKFGTLK